MERVHPSKTGRNIESLNREIMGIARDAAFLYWLTEDERYARLAAGVFDTYMQGMTKFSEITYDEVYTRGLKVMDLTATALCKENGLPIVVFDMDTPGNLAKVIAGEPIGTLVY